MRKKEARWKLKQIVAGLLVVALTVNLMPLNYTKRVKAYAAEGQEDAHGIEKCLRLDAMGGTLLEGTKEVISGEVYGTLPTPIREGYTFDGWFDQKIDGTRVKEDDIVSSRVDELYAYWTPISVQIDLYGNGADNFEDKSITVTYGRTFADLPQLEREDYIFDGWYTAYNGGEKVSKDSLVEYTSSASLYAQWRGKTCEVVFDGNGVKTELEPIKVEYGNPYGELPVLTRNGYEFTGWYLSDTNVTPVTKDSLVKQKENHILYAGWEKNGYKITLEMNSGDSKETKVVYTDEVYGTLPTPTYKGHTFLGWYSSLDDDAMKITSETPLLYHYEHTLYGKWKTNQYEVLLVSSMNGIPNSRMNVTYGESYGALPELEQENYTFMGWYTQPIGGDKVEEGDSVKIVSDQVLYAQWSGDKYTVTFDPVGGTTATESKEVYYGSTYGTLPTPRKTGYDFGGWVDSAYEDKATQVTKDDTVRLKEDQTLYAVWNVKTVEITLNANGGNMECEREIVTTYKFEREYGSRYGYLPEPEREGYIFEGWYTGTSSGNLITATSEVTATTEETLYARWTGRTHLVTFYGEYDENGPIVKEVVYGSSYGGLPIPERENQTFQGWYTDSQNGTKVTAGTLVKTNRNHTLYPRFEGKTVYIYFDSNGGTESIANTHAHYKGQYGVLPSDSRVGYDFLGWYTEPIGGEKIEEGATVYYTENVTLYAHWKPREITLTFNANGGTVDIENKTVVYGSTFGSLPVARREGYTFEGWFASSSSSSEIFSYDTVKLVNDRTYTAHWTANKYTVTLDSNGGTLTTTSKVVTYGSTYGTLGTPKRTGYTFAGWYSKEEYGSKITSSSVVDVAANHTLYAKWKSEIFTITFNAGLGTVSPKNIAVTQGKTYWDFPIPVRDGCNFLGWYTSSSGGQKITSLSVTDTLYAHWEGKTYRVDFDANGGSLSVADKSKKVVFGDDYGTLPTPTKYGYTFSGWYTGVTNGYKRTATSEVTETANHTLYARWRGASAKVSYDTNGGNKITGTKSVIFGNEYGTLSTPSRTGYKFLGWYTDPDEGQLITKESIVDIPTAHTLYAHWEVATPTIEFRGNGGKVDDGSKRATTLEKTYTYGIKYTSLPYAERTGYKFMGWYTSASGGTEITRDTICDITISDIFYAQWQGKESQVTFDANGGETDVKKITVYYNSKYGTLPEPIKEGYTFQGWYTKKFGGELIEEDTVVKSENSHKLYARWKINTYTVILDGNGGVTYIVNAQGDKTAVKQKSHKVPYNGTYVGSLQHFPLFSRTGYDFTGFYTEEGTFVSMGKEFTVNSNQTLYANWRQQRITVTLNANGGTPISEARTVLYGGSYGTLPVLSRVGYDFDGWTKTKGSSVKITDATTVTTRYAHEIYAKWVPKQYQVSFEPNGGTISTSSVTVTYDAKYGALPGAKRSGYTFAGWYTEKEGGRRITSVSIVDVTENTKLYAHWETGVYQITFNGNYGTAEIAAKEVYADESYGELPNAKRKGYHFVGWYTARTGGNCINESDRVTITENQTLYAQWKVKTPNVLFYANGGNLDSSIKTVQYGLEYGELPVPVLENYTFQGWYTKATGGTRVTASNIVSEEETHTLYARWIPNSVMVSFDAMEGSVSVEQKEVSYEASYGELPFPEREQYEFAGWYTEREGGKQVTEKSTVRNPMTHTLYARWEKAKSKISFYGNGGVIDFEEKYGIVGEPYGEFPEAERDGYIFMGWYTKKDGGTKVEETDCVPEGSSITLYAHWQSEKLIVSLDAMGGELKEDTRNVVFGEEYGLLPTPKKQGYRFLAWYLDTEWQNRVEEDTIVETAENHTLYAYYVEDAVEIDKAKGALHFGAEGFNPASGNVSFSCTDMVINFGGLSHTIGRTYNSKNENVSVVGKGWTFDFDGRCYLEEDRAIVFLPDGSMHIFRKTDEGYIGETSHEIFEVNPDGVCVLTKEDRSKYGFNADGTLSYLEDRNGNRTKVFYENGVISKIVDPVGRIYKIAVNDQGYITEIKDPMENTIFYRYNEQNYLTAVSNLLGGVTEYVYDEQGVLEKVIDPNKNVIQNLSYAEQNTDGDVGEVTKSMDAYGNIIQYSYFPERNQTVVTGEDGREWSYWYNRDMYITDIQNPDGSMTKIEYAECEEGFSYGDIKSTVDEYGNKTEYERDANGNVVKITHSDGATVEKQYDEWNNCIVNKDEMGTHTYYLYDVDGVNLLKKIQRVDGGIINEELEAINATKNAYIVEEYCYYSEEEAQELFSCPLSGLLKSVTNGEGEIVTYTYDCYGNTETVTDAAGNVTQYSYDILGHKLSEITPEGNEFGYKYLPNGFVTREYYPDGGVVVSEYDDTGNLTKTIPQELYEQEKDKGDCYEGDEGVRYQYSASGQLLSVTDVLGSTVYYTYDCNGNLVSEAKENAEIITYAYDDRNRLVKQWYQENAKTEKILLKEVLYDTLPNGEYQVTTYLYTTEDEKIVHVVVNDNRGRQKEEYILNGDEKTAHKEYTYYPNGKVSAATENGYTTSYLYDAQGNITEEKAPFMEKNGVVSYVQKTMEYDRAGRMLKQSLSETTATRNKEIYETTFVYENGLLVSETDPTGMTSYYAYDGEGNVIRTVVGDGTVEDGTALVSEATYDFRKNPTTETVYVSKKDLTGNDELLQDVTAVEISYEYNKEGRLVKKKLPDTEISYVYDAAGNVVKEERPVYGSNGELQGIATVHTTYNNKGQVETVTDALGATTRYKYDNRGNLIEVQDALGGITLYAYNYYDQKVAEVSPENYENGKQITDMVRTEYMYDAVGRPVSRIEYRKGNGEPEAVVTKTYIYDTAGNIVKTSDAYGFGTVYTYHPNGQIATELSATEQQKVNGDVISYSYDVYGNVKEVHSDRRDMYYTYDESGRLLSVRDNLGEIEAYVYDGLGRKIASVDGNGNVTTYTYNAFGEISSETVPGDTSIEMLTTYYLYDKNGRPVVVYDTAVNRKEYRYDSMGNVTEEAVLNADTGTYVTTKYQYDLNGNKTEETDALGTVTQFVYDALGRTVQERFYGKGVEAEPKTTSYLYDKNGNHVGTVDYLGNTTTFVFDEWNRETAQYDALGNLVVRNVFDDNSRQISASDALGNTTYYAYDAGGNAITITNSLGAVTAREYDTDGNMIAETDALGNRTGYVYDARNRLVGVQSPMGEYNAYAYDGVGNLTMQTDGAGNRIAYTFNARNLETSRQDIGTVEKPLMDAPKETYAYTADGKLSSKVDRNGVRTTYTYDGLGRLVSEKAGAEEKRYTYDDLGNPLSMINGTNVVLRSYDAEGRVVSKTVSDIGTVTYEYDIPVGNGEVKEVQTLPDGVVKETVYDAAGRISSVSDNQNKTVHYVYNANGSRQAVVYADGTREDYTYDGALHVSTLTHTDRNGNLLDYYEYTYDLAGNLTGETNRNGSTYYVYDANRRIQTVTEPAGKTTRYTYDLAGNRATKEVSYAGGIPIVTEYTYNSSNYLITEVTGDGEVIEYTYDANGNLILEERTVQESIIETPIPGGAVTGSALQISNVMVDEIQVAMLSGAVTGSVLELPQVDVTENGSSMSSEAVTGSVLDIPDITDMDLTGGTSTECVTGSAIRYTYDTFNRMTKYETDEVSAWYTYNAEDYRIGKKVKDDTGIKNTLYFYEGSRVIMEADGRGTITSHNLYGANLISRSTQGKSYYYLYNAHGDVVMLMNTATGTIAGTYRYDAFGNVIMQTGNVDNSVTYAGYQFDEESGLYYLNARYYDSSMARFLTEDTFRGNYEDPLSLNRYTYCHNNPIAYSDPSGHFIVGILVGGLIGGLVGGGIELVNQKFIQKKEKVDWKAVGYEAGAGALFGAVGGALGGVASGVTKTVGSVATKTTLKGVATKAVTTGLTEAVEGFATDVGRQVIVDGKSLDEVDYGQAVKTGAISGVAGAGGYAIGAAGKATKSVAKNAGSTLSEAVTKNVDDAVNEVDSAIVKSVSKSNTADVAVVKKNSVTKTGTATVSSTKTAATTKTTSTAKQTGNTIKTNGDVVTSGKSGTSSRNVAVASINEVKAKSLESGSKTHVPSANTKVVQYPEIKSPNQVKMSDVTNYWDDYLGANQTNIHPRTGLVDKDRIFSADGTRSIRFSNHEMKSMGTTKFHFHQEEWKFDSINDYVKYYNTLIRIKK